MVNHGDIKVEVRKLGNSEPSIKIYTDEGDGLEIFKKDVKITKECYDEWIVQLEVALIEIKGLKDEQYPPRKDS